MKQKERSEIKLEDTWDLTVIFKSDNDFYNELNKLKDDIKDIVKYKGVILKSSKNLLEFLELSDKLERRLYKLYYYAHLNFDVDTTNSKSLEKMDKVSDLMTTYSDLTSFIGPELLKSNFSLIEKYLKEETKLKKYRYNLEVIYRYKKHVLSEKEESLLANLSNSLAASSDIYESLTDSDLTFGNIRVDSKNYEFTESNYSKFIEHKDRNVRKKAFNLLYKTYGKYSHTIANTFKSNIETNTKLAKIRKYNSAIEASLFSDNIDVRVYDNLITTVRNHLDVLYDYYDLKRDVLGLKKLHLYDIYANMVSEVDKTYTFLEAKDIVLDALKVLGDDYQEKLRKAFNNRYIDIYNNKGKRGGAYSSGFYDTNPYILLNFEGKYNDVTTLAHELGHSMHTLYSCEANPYNLSKYKIFVAEVASTVNELILIKYLIKKTNKKQEKLYLLNKLLELFKGTIYRQTMFSEFEEKMTYDHENGTVLTSDYLNKEYFKIVKDYFGNNVCCDDLIANEWMRIPHFYYNFYVYKYAIGLSAACKIVHDIEKLGLVGVERYLKFLKSGGSMDPSDELLLCGVDINKSDYIEEALAFFKETIEEFKKISKE